MQLEIPAEPSVQSHPHCSPSVVANTGTWFTYETCWLMKSVCTARGGAHRLVASAGAGEGKDEMAPDPLAEMAALDGLIDSMLEAQSDDELTTIVQPNVMSLNQKFFLRIATRCDSCADDDTKDRLSVRHPLVKAVGHTEATGWVPARVGISHGRPLAVVFCSTASLRVVHANFGGFRRGQALSGKVMRLLDAIVKKTEGQISQSADLLQTICAAAADPVTGEFEVPLAPERVSAMRQTIVNIGGEVRACDTRPAAAVVVVVSVRAPLVCARAHASLAP